MIKARSRESKTLVNPAIQFERTFTFFLRRSDLATRLLSMKLFKTPEPHDNSRLSFLNAMPNFSNYLASICGALGLSELDQRSNFASSPTAAFIPEDPHRSVSLINQTRGAQARSVEKTSAVHGLDYACLSYPLDDLLDGFSDSLHSPDGDVAFIIGEGTNSNDPGLFFNSLIPHYFRAAISTEPQEPACLASDLNDIVCSCQAERSAVACFYAHYQSSSKTLRYVNAGYRAPLLVRSNPDQTFRLTKGGPPFGSELAPRYSQGTLKLQSGDRLTAFSQGVADMHSEASITRIMRHWTKQPAAEIARSIIHNPPGGSSSTSLDRIVMVASFDEDRIATESAFAEPQLAAVACHA